MQKEKAPAGTGARDVIVKSRKKNKRKPAKRARARIPAPIRPVDTALPSPYPPRHLWPEVYPLADRNRRAILADELSELSRAAQRGVELRKLEKAIADAPAEPSRSQNSANAVRDVESNAANS